VEHVPLGGAEEALALRAEILPDRARLAPDDALDEP
jgi:hypothetical protein